MKLKTTLQIFLLTLCGIMSAQAQIVFADYSDPDVCEGTEGDYWLTASSFQCTPGLPILHSTDLVHWELVNYAVERLLPVEHYNTVQHGCGVWAPSIRRHGDTYYIYWGDPDYGVFMVKTDDPRGRWSEPVLVMEGKGVIDTCPLWDEDGRCYLVNGWANSRCGFNSVLTVRELSADGTRVIGKPVLVYDGQVEGNHTIEGPKFYKKDGYYYILAPAGGVEHGWQVALRSKNVYGPYESKVVFNQDGIHQGGWVADKFICFQERGAYGRILHLLDVKMKNGFPMMKKTLSPDPSPVKGEGIHAVGSSKTNTPKGSPLALYGRGVGGEGILYQWHANYQDAFGFPTPNGVRVYGHNVSAQFKNMWDVPNLYLKKFDGETFADTLHLTITAKADGQQSGFIIMGRDYCRLSVELQNGQFLLKRITCRDADNGGEETEQVLVQVKARKYGAGAKTNYDCHISFGIRCEKGAVCHLSYSLDGQHYTSLPEPFQAREGKWIGAKYGLFSIAPHGSSRGWVDINFNS